MQSGCLLECIGVASHGWSELHAESTATAEVISVVRAASTRPHAHTCLFSRVQLHRKVCHITQQQVAITG